LGAGALFPEVLLLELGAERAYRRRAAVVLELLKRVGALVADLVLELAGALACFGCGEARILPEGGIFARGPTDSGS
jgi:hypothetical protein